jgi:CheY-like chemotaxis protein
MRIRQVLLNLLSNAAKFTDEGSITVRAEVLSHSSVNEEVMVSVEDTGSGISPEDLSKLFQPFSQVDASPTRKTGGSGLGLSISRHLVEMHGGRIGVESEMGAGSTFFFTIPVADISDSVHEPAPKTKEQPTQTKPEVSVELQPAGDVILAVDDDMQVIRMYERYLAPHGYQVIPLTDPDLVMETAQKLMPMAITLDVMMSGHNGWEVLNALKAQPTTRDIPVIICSIVEDPQKGARLGASDYLIKPILEEDMVTAVSNLRTVSIDPQEILIVDDDPADQKVLHLLLEKNGPYQVTVANDGREALETILAQPPDAIILDMVMPGKMNGITFLETLRAAPPFQGIPVIALAEGDHHQSGSTRLDHLAQGTLHKGVFNEDDLLSLLRQALKEK